MFIGKYNLIRKKFKPPNINKKMFTRKYNLIRKNFNAINIDHKHIIHILLYCVIIILYILSLTLGKWIRYDYKADDFYFGLEFDMFKLCIKARYDIINHLRNTQIEVNGVQQYLLPSDVKISPADEKEIEALSSIDLCFDMNNIKAEKIRDDFVDKGTRIIELLNDSITSTTGIINKYIPNEFIADQINNKINNKINEIKNNISNGIYTGIDYTFNRIRNIDTYTPQEVKNGTIKPEVKDRLDIISKLFTYLQYAIITSIVLLFVHILLIIWKGKTSILSGVVTVLIPLICLLIMTVFYFVITFNPKLKNESRQLITSSYMLYIVATVILLATIILSIFRII